MRIISGSLKGKSINFIKNSKTRPLKDAVKENIFNILKHSNFTNVKVENANVLDLYSGVGSFGLESISRGAKQVTFIEGDKTAANILKENLIKLCIVGKAKIINDKVDSVLIKNNKEKFNIFFLDPPFNDKKYIENFKLLKKNKLFFKNHIIIIHREKKTEDYLENYLDIKKIKKYGRSKIIFGSIK
tara:strand:- start:747 stop:1307 length:561 start_codon:yes stop_codon:yes gene_type:complete